MLTSGAFASTMCVTSISRNRENLSWSRRKIDSVLEYLFTFASRAYVIVWFKFLCSSGIPPYYQLFLSWTEEKFWHSVGKWPAFHRIDDELTNPEKRVKPPAVKCSCSTLILWSVWWHLKSDRRYMSWLKIRNYFRR